MRRMRAESSELSNVNAKPMRCEEGDDHRWDGFPLRREDPRARPIFFLFFTRASRVHTVSHSQLTRQYQYEYPYPIPSHDDKKTPSLPSVCFMPFLQKRPK